MNLKTGYGYIRVSTHDQEELSPDSQERLLREYAKSNGILLEQIFVDAGISGRKADKRPAFQEMIAKAKDKEHPVDVLLVWKFSRFARNQEESIVYKSLLKKAGVDVISVSEPLADGPFGSLIERIIEWMDEYYSIRLSGEVKRGMLENATRGNYQTAAPFGYRNDHGSLVICPEEAEYVRLIFRKFREENVGYITIAKLLNQLGLKTRRGGIWENRTVKYILQNPAYKGYVRWNVGKENLRKGPFVDAPDMICVKGDHEPIITEEYFDAVQEQILKLYKAPKTRPSGSYGHWLGNLVKCSCCGLSVTYVKAHDAFQCTGYTHGKCPESHFIKASKLEAALIDALEERINSGTLNFSTAPVEPVQLSGEYILLKESLAKLSVREKRIKLAYQNGIDTLDEYKENKALLQVEKDRLLSRIAEFEQEPATDPVEIPDKIKNALEILKSDADSDIKSNAIRSFCDKVVYDKKSETLDIYCVLR